MPYGVFDPMLPKSVIQPAQDWLEEPSLEQSPWMARLKGFGSGALDGLRSMTTPADALGLLVGGVGSGAARGGLQLAKGAGKAVRGLTKAAPAALKETGPIIGSAIGEVGPDIAAAASRGGLQRTLGEIDPIFSPSDGLDVLNTNRGLVKASDRIPTGLEGDNPNFLEAFQRAKAQPGYHTNPAVEKLAQPDLMDDFVKQSSSPQGFDWPELGGRFEADAIGSHKLVKPVKPPVKPPGGV